MYSVKSTSSKLLKVQLNVVPANQCNDSYASSIGHNLTRGIDKDSQICAGYLQGGKDACGVRRFFLKFVLIFRILREYIRSCKMVDAYGFYQTEFRYFVMIPNTWRFRRIYRVIFILFFNSYAFYNVFVYI